MTREIESVAALEEVHTEATRLLNAGDAGAAIALVDACHAVPGQETNVMQLQAAIHTDGGLQLARRDLVEHSVTLWKRLGPDDHQAIAYNLANAELGLYQLGVAHGKLCTGWQDEREHLRTARALYERIGEDASAPAELRLQAWTNAGNAYDIVGRNLDALNCYDRALDLDPHFGMALGNRGVALHHFAPFMGKHAPTVVHQASLALDAALVQGESVIRSGGDQALQRFEALRKTMPSPTPAGPSPRRDGQWANPHLDWCHRNQLFLHVSHECLRENTETLDPLFFRSVVTGTDEDGQQRIRDLVDAFNAVKQEYVTARYVTWLSSDRRSPIREQAAAIASRVRFLDSLEYARWGVRTGMAIEALTAATNVLDKVASFVHLYLATARRARGISFAALWQSAARKPMDPELAAILAGPERNIGLLALCDLSCDVGAATPLSRRYGLRHTATHRFLVAHTDMVPNSNDWFDRVSWPDLVRETIAQLRIARAALVYLAWLVDTHESARRRAAPTTTSTIPSMPIPPVDTDLVEHE